MINPDINSGGCSKHGPFNVCGHTDVGCPLNEGHSSVEAETDKPEAWLNQEREAVYAELVEEIRGAYEKGISGGQYLASLIEDSVSDYGTKVRFGNWLKPADRDQIHFVLHTSKSLNEVAGTQIVRPLFMVDNEALYTRLEAMFDMKSGGSHGVHFSPGFFDSKSKWEKVGLIVVKDNQDITTHEARHSVDPLLAHGSDKREGCDRVISELFAFYKEFILDNESPNWNGLVERVLQYYPNYTSKNKLSLLGYTDRVKNAVNGLKRFRAKYGDVETQRKLVQAKTLVELFDIV
ncbi:MAG: hypothetical protein ACD_72C00359G0001 [uncultured bacterium]|nr:MAG: hypothetical protein ACD_72C00359G0001 [uncultured bacterium]